MKHPPLSLITHGLILLAVTGWLIALWWLAMEVFNWLT